VPRSRDGWKRRQRLTITPLVELERLRPACIDVTWLVSATCNEMQKHRESMAQSPENERQRTKSSQRDIRVTETIGTA